MSLDVRCPEHLEQARAFADQLGGEARANLEGRLAYLALYGGEGRTLCRLFSDFAPHSFAFVMFRMPDDGGEPIFWFNGGLIYHGPGSRGSAFPTLAVEVDPLSRPHWSVHS